MNFVRFDRLCKTFASRRLSRRQTVTMGASALAAGAFAAGGIGQDSGAQNATPSGEWTPVTGQHESSLMFVQTFQSGSVAPVDGANGRYALTLSNGTGQTVYFSDRPDRIVGASPTPRMLEQLGFTDDDPPNAALVVQTELGESDVAVLELFAPAYDPATRGVRYEVEVLANWRRELDLELTEAPTDLAALAPNFGSAHLFIDSSNVWEGYVACHQGGSCPEAFVGPMNMCGEGPCDPPPPPYEDWYQYCNGEFEEGCGGDCTVFVTSASGCNA